MGASTHIAVLAGGFSGEADVSRRSAAMVMAHMVLHLRHLRHLRQLDEAAAEARGRRLDQARHELPRRDRAPHGRGQRGQQRQQKPGKSDSQERAEKKRCTAQLNGLYGWSSVRCLPCVRLTGLMR